MKIKLKKQKFKVIELPEMVGKTLQEVKDYLEKTYPGQLAKEEHQEEFEKVKPDTSDWRSFYFFGSLRYSCGRWNVPCVRWDGSEFDRRAGWLGYVWNSPYRVVLLETFEKVESLTKPFDSLDFESRILELEDKVGKLLKVIKV